MVATTNQRHHRHQWHWNVIWHLRTNGRANEMLESAIANAQHQNGITTEVEYNFADSNEKIIIDSLNFAAKASRNRILKKKGKKKKHVWLNSHVSTSYAHILILFQHRSAKYNKMTGVAELLFIYITWTAATMRQSRINNNNQTREKEIIVESVWCCWAQLVSTHTQNGTVTKARICADGVRRHVPDPKHEHTHTHVII